MSALDEIAGEALPSRSGAQAPSFAKDAKKVPH
jgi:hypothetical protein